MALAWTQIIPGKWFGALAGGFIVGVIMAHEAGISLVHMI
jgi:hypothetical protein